MITVSLNDQRLEVSDNMELNLLLDQHPPEGAFAVAINGEFVPRSRYANTRLTDGDLVDIVSPVGGG